MAEIMTPQGTWTFDGEHLRIDPGYGKRVHKVRKALGTVRVPLAAIEGTRFTRERKGGRLRLLLRAGTDPLSLVSAGRLPADADPYQLAVGAEQVEAAEYLTDAVRYTPLPDPTGDDGFLVPGPDVPLSVTTSEATITFDGERVRLDWGWQASEAKRANGAVELPLQELTGVDWQPTAGLNDGALSFSTTRKRHRPEPAKDPHTVRLSWGTESELLTVLVAAAITARLPHPQQPETQAASPAEGQNDTTDEALRRLRELGALHREGILDDDEFAMAKQAILRRL